MIVNDILTVAGLVVRVIDLAHAECFSESLFMSVANEG